MKIRYRIQILLLITIFFQANRVYTQTLKNNSKHMENQISQSFSIPANETFDNTWPFKPHFKEILGFQMHYVDEGTGGVILALHGEPTWGYLFRNLIVSLSPDHRVIVPDHMGFGKSETPQDRSYLLQDHINNIEQLVLKLDLKDITLVMHDFGGPVGMGLASRHPDRIKSIISTNGPTPLGQPNLVDTLMKNGNTSPWFSWIFKAYEEGTLEQILGHLDYNILSTLKLNGFENNDLITDTWLQAYSAPFKTPKHTLGAIGWAKGFAEGTHQFESVDLITAKKLSKKPALAIWGMADKTLQSKYFLPLFNEAFPNGEIYRLEKVGHYSLEDAPEEITTQIKTFLKNL